MRGRSIAGFSVIMYRSPFVYDDLDVDPERDVLDIFFGG
jgi:hypothetical protein